MEYKISSDNTGGRERRGKKRVLQESTEKKVKIYISRREDFAKQSSFSFAVI